MPAVAQSDAQERSQLLALLCLASLACGQSGVAAPVDAGTPLDGGASDGGNRLPNAVIDAPTTGDVLSELTLDGRRSSDPDGDHITDYAWQIREAPTASTAALRDLDKSVAYLRPDKPGRYVVRLSVFTGITGNGSADATITVSDTCCKPISRAGANRIIALTDTLTLDGSGSTDPRNEALTYAWRIAQQPDGAASTLERANTPMATFRPDPARPHALYTLELVVTNTSRLASDPASTELQIRNSIPTVTLLGPERPVAPGTAATLEAVAQDGDMDPLTYAWRVVSQPGADGAITAIPGTSTATLTTQVSLLGDYVVEVLVRDGFGGEATARHTVSTANQAPVADAGDPQTTTHTCIQSGACSATARFTGVGTDAEGDSLISRWDVAPGNEGPGNISFSNPVAPNTSVTIQTTSGPISGTYRLRYCVKDTLHDFQCDTTELTVTNALPTAFITAPADVEHLATPAGSRTLQTTIDLRGSGREAELEQGATNAPYLRYAWSGPRAGESADPSVVITFDNANAANPRATLRKDCSAGCGAGLGLLGNYTFHLDVRDPNDGVGSALHTVAVRNTPPTVTITGPRAVAGGAAAQLTAVAADVNANALTYTWRLAAGSAGSLSVGPTPDKATLTTSSTSGGFYKAEVVVNDGFADSMAASHEVLINAPPVVTAPTSATVGHQCISVNPCAATTTLTGAATDPENDSMQLRWRLLPPAGREDVTATFSPENTPATTLTLRAGTSGSIASPSGAPYLVELCAKDDLHDFVCATSQLTVTNQAPVATASGPGIVYHEANAYEARITLEGRCRDPEYQGIGEPPYATYLWTLPTPSDPQVTVSFAPGSTESSQVPTFIARWACGSDCSRRPVPLLGPLSFALRVGDRQGATATASSTVEIRNRMPNLTLSAQPPPKVRPNQDVPLTAFAGDDADGDTLRYTWRVTPPLPAVPFTLNNPPLSPQAILHLPDRLFGRFTVTVTASDGYEARSADASIDVLNSPPTVPGLSRIGSGSLRPGQTFTLQATNAPALDDDGDAVTLNWRTDVGPPGTPTPTPGPGNTAAVTLPAGLAGIGSYSFSVQACDVWDACTTRVPYQFQISNEAPTIEQVRADSASVRPNQSTTLRTINANDPDGDALTFNWRILSPPGATAVGVVPDGATATFAPSNTQASVGTYSVGLVVCDSLTRCAAEQTVTVAVVNTAPAIQTTSIVYNPVQSPRSALRDGSDLNITVPSSDAESDAVTLTWALVSGPGTITPTGASTARLATMAGYYGDYVLSVTPRDAWTSGAAETLTIRVNRPPTVSTPTASLFQATACASNGRCEHRQSLAGVVADTEGAQVPYRWEVVSAPPGVVATFSQPNGTATSTSGIGQTVNTRLDLVASSALPSTAVGIAGTYRVRLCANDDVYTTLAEARCGEVSFNVTNGAPNNATVRGAPAGDTLPEPPADGALANPSSGLHRTFNQGSGVYQTRRIFYLKASARDPESQAENQNLRWTWEVIQKADPNVQANAFRTLSPLVAVDQSDSAVYLVLHKDYTPTCPPTNPGIDGVYRVRVTATDIEGASTTEEIQLTIGNEDPDSPDLAPATVDHTYVLDGDPARPYRATAAVAPNNASEPSGDPLCYSWSLPAAAPSVCALNVSQTDCGTAGVAANAVGGAGPTQLLLRGDTRLVQHTAYPQSHQSCLRATDPWGRFRETCRAMTVLNRPPSTPSAGFSDNQTIGHTYSAGIYRATISTATPSAYSDPDNDPAGTHTWTTTTVGLGATGPAPGSTGAVQLTSSGITNLVGASRRVCVRARDVFGEASPEVDGQSCRLVTVTNVAPTLTAASLSTTAPNFCGCGAVRLTATVGGNSDGDPVTVTFTKSSGTCSNPGARSCTVTGTGSCSVDIDVTCPSGGGSIGFSASATDGIDTTSLGVSGTFSGTCGAACGGVCGC